MSGFQQSRKQREIMRLLIDATAKGEELTMSQLKERLSYGKDVSRQAVQCSIRYLEGHGMLVKKNRGRTSTLLMPTAAAMARYRKPDFSSEEDIT